MQSCCILLTTINSTLKRLIQTKSALKRISLTLLNRLHEKNGKTLLLFNQFLELSVQSLSQIELRQNLIVLVPF